jgi:hypothetical protein
MKTEAIKAALANLDKTATLYDLPDSEFVTGGAITTACRAAGYDESGRAAINQMNVWSSTVGELETMLCEQEQPVSYELRSAKYDAATNSTRIVYAPENGTAAEAKEDVIYHDAYATETERADKIDAFIAARAADYILGITHDDDATTEEAAAA